MLEGQGAKAFDKKKEIELRRLGERKRLETLLVLAVNEEPKEIKKGSALRV